MEMGKEIRRLRNDRGITQEALAAALNVTAQTVSKWECGTSMPDVQTLPEIAVYFGVTIDQLFAMAPEQQMPGVKLDGRADLYAFGLLLKEIFPHRYRYMASKCSRKDRENPFHLTPRRA